MTAATNIVGLGAAAIALLASAPAAQAQSSLVCLRDVAPTIVQDMRYAGPNNFTGEPVPGYAAAECWLARPAAQALAKVQAEMEKNGRTLIVYDCYRPVRAVRHFMAWAKKQGARRDPTYFPRVDGSKLVAQGYIAARSGHSTGYSVDLSYGSAGGTEAVDTGGPFDLFDYVSHTNAKVSDDQRRNRNLLVAAMAEQGFANYAAEWWHYSLRGNAPAQDTPVRACGAR